MSDTCQSVRIMMNAALTTALDETGSVYVDFDEYNSVNIKAFNEEVINSDFVYSYGGVVSGSFAEYVPYLWQRQKENYTEIVKEYDGADGSLMYYSFMNCFDVFGIELYKGEIVEQQYIDELYNKGNFGIYLGYEYRDIEVGTEFECQNGSKCIVLGILKKNSKWLGNSAFQRGDMILNMNFLINMDYAFLIPEPLDILSSPSIISFKGISFAEGSKRLSQIAEKHRIIADCESFDNLIWYSERKEKNVITLLYICMAFIVTIFIIVVSRMQKMSVMERKYEFGVLISSGASMKDISSMIIIENIIKWIIAGVIAFSIGYVFAYFRYGQLSFRYISFINYTAIHLTIWKYLATTIIIMIMSTVSAYSSIKKMNIIDLFL